MLLQFPNSRTCLLALSTTCLPAVNFTAVYFFLFPFYFFLVQRLLYHEMLCSMPYALRLQARPHSQSLIEYSEYQDSASGLFPFSFLLFPLKVHREPKFKLIIRKRGGTAERPVHLILSQFIHTIR
jgi:hypothetical protein